MNHALARELHSDEREPSLRILLAEDSGELRRLLALVLHRDGHVVVEVRDAGELLDALASTLITPTQPRFDLVICEQTLRGLQGLTVLAGLRARDRETPFILISDDAEVQERAKRLGGVILGHPFNVEAIRSSIRKVAPPAPG
jgi:CheY-like chemotaxis protein